MNNGIKGNYENKFFTIEFFGVTLILTSFLLLVCLLFGEGVLFEVGSEIQIFLLGVFGYFSYPFLLVLFTVGFMMLLGKKPTSVRAYFKAIKLFGFVSLILLLLTVITGLHSPSTLSEYVNYAYQSGRNGVFGVVAGGVLYSLLAFPIVKLLTFVGAIILIVFAILVCVFVWLKRYSMGLKSKPQSASTDKDGDIAKALGGNTAEPTQPTQQPVYPSAPAQPINQGGFVSGVQGYGAPQGYGAYSGQNYQPQQPQVYGYNLQPNSQGYYPNQNGYDATTSQGVGANNVSGNGGMTREEAMRILYGNAPSSTYSSVYGSDYTQNRVNVAPPQQPTAPYPTNDMISSDIPKTEPMPRFNYEDKTSSATEFTDNYSSDEDDFDIDYSSDFTSGTSQAEVENDTNVNIDSQTYVSGEENLNIKEVKIRTSPTDENSTKTSAKDFFSGNAITEPSDSYNEEENSQDNQVDDTYTKYLIENMPLNYKYNAPPVSLLKTVDKSGDDYQFELFKVDVKNKILSTLKDFGIETQIARVFRGPAVTRFDIEIPRTVPLGKVTKLQNDINLRIAASSPIRMIAPVPNTSYVGIEVPNEKREMVTIKDIISSEQFINSEDFTLMFALGKDVIGTPVSLDLAQMPHVLVTGTTGSGKSVCLNSMIISLILKYSPEELRFIIVDPKAVEFEVFADMPHLLFGEIIKEDIPLTNAMLTWAVEEMARRYETFSKHKLKDIKGYNKKMRSLGQKIMHRLVIVIDEFADIMLKDKNGANTKICLLAQKARAAGIHLVLAAQRPSVDIIEGPIKANLPSRIVFRATAYQDSVTSLGEGGAEKLLGKGDCLYKTDGMFAVERVMGAYVSDEEIFSVIEYVNNNNEKYFDRNSWSRIKANCSSASDVVIDSTSTESLSSPSSNAIDPLNIKAMRIGYDFGGLSTSFLQRKLGVGYPRAAKIIDWLTDNGYITPNSIQGKKKMIMTKEEFINEFGEEE